MDKLNTYALLAAIKGIDPKSEVIDPAGERKRQNDKWIALQSSDHEEVPAHRMRLDPPPQTKPYDQRNIYIKEVNDRMNRAIKAQGVRVNGITVK